MGSWRAAHSLTKLRPMQESMTGLTFRLRILDKDLFSGTAKPTPTIRRCTAGTIEHTSLYWPIVRSKKINIYRYILENVHKIEIPKNRESKNTFNKIVLIFYVTVILNDSEKIISFHFVDRLLLNIDPSHDLVAMILAFSVMEEEE